MPNLKLQSSDGKVFEVDVEIAKVSVTINAMVEALGIEDDDDEAVPLQNVNSNILEKVIQWASYHHADPPEPEPDESVRRRTDDISSWDADFMEVDLNTVCELALAANYLEIRGLLDLTSKVIANMISGKTDEEVRQIFDIENDMESESSD